jgi:hypothetical protein
VPPESPVAPSGPDTATPEPEPTTTTDAVADAGADAGEGRGGARIGRLVVLAVVVGLVAMWGYVVFLAFGPGRQPPLDRLEDPSFARAAEDVCVSAVADVEGLPEASEASSAEQRAGVVAEANARFEGMLGDLDGLVDLAPGGDQRDRVERWLADWRTFLGDREEFASALRTDPEARMLVSEKAGTGRHITAWIDEFARANRMPSCISPADV